MAIITPQRPSIGVPITPTFTTISAADKFTSGGGGTYIILYSNGATPGTATFWVLDGNNPGAVAPVGSQAPAIPTGATKWSDAQIVSSMSATSLRMIAVDNVNMPNFTDSTGFVNLKHNGTITGNTVGVFGPF